MRLPRVRFTVRRMMAVVAALALVMAALIWLLKFYLRLRQAFVV